jgi:hypothetical protein
MHYVIQKHHDDPKKHFISYKVPKYITSKTNENIILEFSVNGKAKRKWAPKKDIILLTENIEYFKAILSKLAAVEDEHLIQIKEAEEKLNSELKDLFKTMHTHFDDFAQEKKMNPKIPCKMREY